MDSFLLNLRLAIPVLIPNKFAPSFTIAHSAQIVGFGHKTEALPSNCSFINLFY